MSDEIQAGTGIRRHKMPDMTFAEGMVTRIGVTLKQVAVAIANNQSVSDPIDCGAGYPVALYGPPGWTAAALGFEVSLDAGQNWRTMKDVYREYLIEPFEAGTYLALPAADFQGLRYFRLRSGTKAAPVAQLAARDFIVLVAP